MSLPMEFSFDGAAVRVVLLEGEPWWVAADVCKGWSEVATYFWPTTDLAVF